MTMKITGNNICGAETGISVPAGGSVEIAGNLLRACQRAIEVREPPRLGRQRQGRTDWLSGAANLATVFESIRSFARLVKDLLSRLW